MFVTICSGGKKSALKGHDSVMFKVIQSGGQQTGQVHLLSGAGGRLRPPQSIPVIVGNPNSQGVWMEVEASKSGDFLNAMQSQQEKVRLPRNTEVGKSCSPSLQPHGFVSVIRELACSG